MRTLFPRATACALASLLSLAAVPALAVDQDIELTATVASSCTLSGSAAPAALTATIPVTNGEVSTTPLEFDIPIACNTPPILMVGTLKGGLRAPVTSPGTTSRIDYIARLTNPWFVPVTLDTETMPGQFFIEGSAPSAVPNGSMTLTITPKQPAQLLRDGVYTDTLRISVTPYQ